MHQPFVVWDHLLLLGLLGSAVVEWRWQYPSFVRAVEKGVPGVRSRYYAVAIVTEWVCAAGLVALWIVERRPWSGLLLGGGPPWRLAIGWALAAAYVWLALAQRRALLSRPKRLERLMTVLTGVVPLLPRTPGERRGFATLSVTAGICEELLFRGFVLWYATQWAGPIAAFPISCAIFGFVHIYFGPDHVPRTAIAGALFYLVAMAGGSLLPAMVCHAVADLVSGDITSHALAAAGGGAGPATGDGGVGAGRAAPVAAAG